MVKITQNQTTIFVALITALGVIFGGPVLSDFLARRHSDFKELRADERNIVDRLIIQHTELLEKYAELNDEVMSLREEVKKLKSTKAHRDSKELIAVMMNSKPWPSWFQVVEERIWYLNDAYCKEFGVVRKDFWTPVNILAQYPAKTVSQYISNDMKVLESNATMYFHERVPRKILLPESSENPAKLWHVVKYPIPVNGTKYMMGDAFFEEKDSILDYVK